MQTLRPKPARGRLIRAARLCGLAALGAGLVGSAALAAATPVFAQAAPAPAPATAHHRSSPVYARDGVIFEVGQTGHRYSFTASNGETITVVSDDPNPPSPEQQRRWEIEVRDAEAKAAAAEALVNSPEFKAKIAKAKASAAAAEAMVNSPAFKARIAKAKAAAAEAEAMVNSPEFKARMARLRDLGDRIGRDFDDRDDRAPGPSATTP